MRGQNTMGRHSELVQNLPRWQCHVLYFFAPFLAYWEYCYKSGALTILEG